MSARIICIILVLVLVICAAYVVRCNTNTPNTFIGGFKRKTSKKKIPRDKIKNLKEFPASKFENQVRDIIESMTGKKFPTVYPYWLKYKGKSLELDGYSDYLSLAFETQGPQHTRWDKKDDPRKYTYYNRIENDEAKIRICDENNVGLIVIDHKIPKHLLGSYIRSRIYDISVIWRKRKLTEQIKRLGNLAYKYGDYIEPIIHEPVV